MFVRILVLLLAAVLAVAVAARRSSGAAHQQTYIVRPGDTLWSIAAGHYAGDPREGVWKIEGENAILFRQHRYLRVPRRLVTCPTVNKNDSVRACAMRRRVNLQSIDRRTAD